MKKRLLFYTSIVCVIGILTQSCEKDDKELKPEFSLEQPDQISDEIYDIYSLVINERFSSEKIVIAQATTTGTDLNYEMYPLDDLIKNHQDFDSSLVQIHNDLNENSVNFGEQFHSDTKEIILISSDEISYIFDSQDLNGLIGDWEEFHKDYENSNGIIHFSRIALNADNTQAIFKISSSYGYLNGGTSIVFLENIEDNWTILEVILAWVS